MGLLKKLAAAGAASAVALGVSVLAAPAAEAKTPEGLRTECSLMTGGTLYRQTFIDMDGVRVSGFSCVFNSKRFGPSTIYYYPNGDWAKECSGRGQDRVCIGDSN